MPTLQIQLLGGFQLLYDGALLTTVNQARQQSLLVYLLLHRHTPQSRQQLAFLFWPDSSEVQAHTNLRRELHHLRHSLPDAAHYLQIAARSIQWRSNALFKLDVADFEDLLEQANLAAQAGRQAGVRAALEGALELYRGRLLPTCYDDWILPTREQMERRFERGLEQLILLLEDQRDYLTAIRYAQQMLYHDSLHEPTYRRLMRLHGLNGDPASALRVYHSCASILQRELEVAPTQETQEAYARLLNRDVPQVLQAQTAAAVQSVVRLVGRQPEWQQLRTAWRKAVQGQAHCVLVAGEAGIGKTRLTEELFESVSQQGIVAARTRSYAAEGARAYAPVIEWLRAVPFRSTLDKLDEVWLTEVARLLPELLVERPALPRPEPLSERWQRQRLFEALARALTGDGLPRLLLIDDLQWCDPETLEWLRYLLHYDLGARLLIVGTLRSEEVDPDHPLRALVMELRNSKQLTEVELGPLDVDDTTALASQVAGQELAPAIKAQLYRETEGNPLFVVETVRAEVSKRAAGQALPATDALAYPRPPSSMPAKVHAVIQSRLAQLSSPVRELASLAATIGRSFTFEVLAHASDSSEDTLVRGLDELWQRGIVREQGGNAYDFSHDRIREAAFAAISPLRRRLLHRRVAEALETVHEVTLDGVSGQIAAHFEQAGLPAQAIAYYQRAGEVAQRVCANQEACLLFRRALALLTTFPDSRVRAERELALHIALGVLLSAIEGPAAQAVQDVYVRARALCQQLGKAPYIRIRGLANAYVVREELRQAHDLLVELLNLAQHTQEPEHIVEAHTGLGSVLFWMGKFIAAQQHLEQAIAHYQPARDQGHTARYAWDSGITCRQWLALVLWFLGYPDRALQSADEGLTLARELAHPLTYVYSLATYCRLQQCVRNASKARTYAEEATTLSTKYSFPLWSAVATVFHGWALAELGQPELGLAQIHQGMLAHKNIGAYIQRPWFLGMLAEVSGKLGRSEDSLAALNTALAIAQATEDRVYEAELLRLKGELLLGQDTAEAELYFQRAIELARTQRTKSLELRAVLSLSRLWQSQGKQAEARQLLAEIYGWFSEGFDTPDLQAAKTLMEELS